METRNVVVAQVLRTPWCRPGLAMERFMSSDLAAPVLLKLLESTGVAPELVDQVVFGQGHPSTMPNNIGHYAWLKAQLPVEVPGYTVQSNTASALQAVRNAYYLIASGNEQICIAGGADSYSAAPFVMRDVRNHFYPKDRVVQDSLEEAERCTQPGPMSRLEQYEEVYPNADTARAEAFGAQSLEKAAGFQALYGEQLVPISYTDRKKGEVVFSQDSYLQGGENEAFPLAPYADGAAAAMLMSREKAQELGVTPLAEILGFAVAGGDTVKRQETGAAAVKKLLERKGLTMDDVAVVEILENSAQDVLETAAALGGSPSVNPLGGALAYGLNDGAEGIAMLQRLIVATKPGQLGVLCMYGAGGQGMAALIARC